MTRDVQYFPLLQRSLLVLGVGAVLVTLCYYFVDRPVAYFVRDHDIHRFVVLKWLTYPPPIIQTWAPAVLIGLVIRRAFGPFRRWEQALFAAAVSLIVAVQFKNTLKYTFGRDWPDTWIDDNPSLFQDDAYGFHPFDGSIVYGSFPSGHTARVLSLVAVYWIAYPRWRWAGALATAAIVVGLIGMNYHFVGDTIAGGVVGGLVGMYTAYFCRLNAVDDHLTDSQNSAGRISPDRGSM